VGASCRPHRPTGDAEKRTTRKRGGLALASPTVHQPAPAAPRERLFFSTVSSREWTWIKHSILGRYMRPWSMKVGKTASRIWVVDCFAGAGSYDDELTGERRDGSPVIAALEAQRYEAARPGREMRVICVERNRANFRDLQARVTGFGNLVTPFSGNFARHISTIVGMIGNDPALVLLDPIGLKALRADYCAALLGRSGKTDAFVIVDFAIVHRTRGQLRLSGEPRPEIPGSAANAANIDAFFSGSTRWRSVSLTTSAEERERAYLRIYFEDVLSKSFSYLGACPVRKAVGATPEYWMVHAASHIDAHLLMNDEIARVDEALYLRTYGTDAIPQIVESMYATQRTSRLAELKNDLLVFIRRQGPNGTTFHRVVENMLGRHFGLAKVGKWSGDYARLLRELVEEGEIRRQKQPLRAAFDRGERLVAIAKNDSGNEKPERIT
jgi:three-Cys-motif partner protein